MKAWGLGVALVAATASLMNAGGVFDAPHVPDAREWVVVDERGDPVEGATVSLIADLNAHVDEPALRTTTTNARGRFELDLEGGEIVHAWKPGRIGDYRMLDTTPPVTLTLKPATVLVGKVVSAERGTPIAGAKVVPIFAHSPRWQLEAITDADGSFRLDGLDPDHDYLFSVQAPQSFATRCEFEIQGAGEVETTFSITTEPVLRGRVIDLETNEPIGGATLVTESYETDYRRVETATSAADGTFSIGGVPQNPFCFAVIARKHGLAAVRREFQVSNLFSADVNYEWRMPRAGVVEGEVTGVERGSVGIFDLGEPSDTPNAPKNRSFGDSRFGERPYIFVPLQSGRFRIEGVPAGWGNLMFHTRRDGIEVILSKFGPLVERFGESKTVDLAIEPLARIYGVTTVGGVPAQFRVGWKRGEFSGSNPNSDSTQVGRYELHCPVSGELTLVFHPGGGYPLQEFPIHVVAGGTQRRDLELRADLSRIRGVAYRSSMDWREAMGRLDPRDLSGFPRYEVGVRITATRPRDGAQVECATRADGSFELVLPDASWDEWNVALDKTRFDTWFGEGIRSGATVAELVGFDLDR